MHDLSIEVWTQNDGQSSPHLFTTYGLNNEHRPFLADYVENITGTAHFVGAYIYEGDKRIGHISKTEGVVW